MNRFDAVTTNPPFQRGNGNQGGPLWIPFSHLGARIVKPEGHLLYVTPATWTNGKSIYPEILRSHQTIHLNINECKKYFKSSGFNTYSYWLVKMSSPNGKTDIVSMNSNGPIHLQLDLQNNEYLPPSWIKSKESLEFHEIVSGLPKMEFLAGDKASYKLGKFNNKKDKGHPYKIIYSKKRTIYSETPGYLEGAEKVLFWNTSNYIDEFSYDESIVSCGIGRQVSAIIPPVGVDPKRIKDIFSGKFFRFCDNLYREGAYFAGHYFPYIDLSLKWDDEKLYSHFGLSPNIIDYIESIEWVKKVRIQKVESDLSGEENLHNKRIGRRKVTAEDFTPELLVNEMLDLLPNDIWGSPEKTFIDPAAGNGNFLVAVLQHKLDHGHDPLQALSTTYGVELMEDNVEEMKSRLLELIPEDLHKKAIPILNHNIVCHDALTWDYDNWCPPNSDKAEPLF